jgi:ABC-type phosphate transport system substrate-binding protein
MKSISIVVAAVAAIMILNTIPVCAQASDPYVVVVNKEMGGSAISLGSLKGIYLREMRKWDANGDAIIPVDLSDEADVCDAFYKGLFGKSHDEMRFYWLNMKIKNSVDVPVSKKTSEQVKQYVASNKSAIGFIKSSNVDDTVKVLKINK